MEKAKPKLSEKSEELAFKARNKKPIQQPVHNRNKQSVDIGNTEETFQRLAQDPAELKRKKEMEAKKL